MKTTRIALLAYEGCMGMEIFGLCDTLLVANRVALALEGSAGAPLFEVAVISVTGNDVAAAGGLRIGTRRAPRKSPASRKSPARSAHR